MAAVKTSTKAIDKVKTALAEKPKSAMQTIEEMLKNSEKELGKALPSHMTVERLMRIYITMLRLNPSLQGCDPYTIRAGIFQMAQLGLEPIDGQAYLVPYNNSKRGIKEAQFQIGYKGLVTLFYRHESAVSLNWGIVCDNDTFEYDKGAGILSHKINLKAERGPAYAYWVKAKLKNGAEIFEVMSLIEILKFARQHSKAFNSGPWQTDRDAMCLKTVLKQLMKLLPKSVEIQKAISLDDTTKRTIDVDMSQVPDETIYDDGKTIDATPETKALPGDPTSVPGNSPVTETGQVTANPADDPGAVPGQASLLPEETMTRSDGVVLNKKTGRPI
jgi:recombination protein RecT